MIIRVNDEKLDFTIEKEEELQDVLSSIENWVGGEGGIIQKVLVDREDVPLTDEAEGLHRDITSIGEIEVYAATKERHATEALSTLGDYILMILDRSLEPDPHSSYEEIMKGLDTVVEAVRDSSLVLGIRVGLVLGSGNRPLDGVLRELDGLRKRYERRYFEKEGRSAIVSSLKELFARIPKLLKWAVVKNPETFDEVEKNRKQDYFREVLADFQAILGDTEMVFEKIAENLQIGNDPEAMGDIYRVTEILDECIELLKIAEGHGIDKEKLQGAGTQAEETFRDISSRLNETYEALKLGDMVTVGDIMEYEIHPLWKRLAGLLSSIEDFIR